MKKVISSFSFVLFLISLTLLFLLIKKKEMENVPLSSDPVTPIEAMLAVPEKEEPIGSGEKSPDLPDEDQTNTAVLSVSMAQTHAASPTGAAESGTENLPWHSYHGSSTLTGSSPVSLPGSLVPLWQTDAEGAVLGTPVYSGSAVFFATVKGSVFAVDPEGEFLWSAKIITGEKADGTPRFASFEVPLLYLEGTVYACDADGTVIALDAAAGNELWRSFLDITVLGAPNYKLVSRNGMAPEISIYIIDQTAGALYCLDGATGEKKWISETGVGRCEASPGVYDEYVLFGSCASALHVFSSSTGKHLYDLPLGNDAQVASGVAISDGKGLSGSRNGNLVLIDLKEEKTIWDTRLSRHEIFSTPAVSNQWVVVGDENGSLYGVSFATGEKRWETSLGGSVLSPVIVGDHVAVSADGSLYLLTLASGERSWSYALSDEITSPCVAGNMLVVGSSDATVTAFAGNRKGEEGI